MLHLGSHPADQRLLRSRLYLLGLFLAFLGPFLVAVLLYHDPDLRAGARGASHGALIAPARPLPRAWFSPAGTAARWTLLYRAQAPQCGLHCEADLFLLRQVRASLGKLRARMQVRVMLEREAQRARFAPFLRGFPADAVQVRPDGFPEGPFAEFPPDGIYVVDPLGNLLMHYGDDATASGMRDDLKRLLSASRIG